METQTGLDLKAITENERLNQALLDISPEDAPKRLEFLAPLSRTLRTLEVVPQLPPTPMGLLIACMWMKEHPSSVTGEMLVQILEHPAAMLRLAAVEALQARVELGATTGPEQAQIARAVELRRESEASPLICFQLKNLAEGLSKLRRPVRRRRMRAAQNPYIAGIPISKGENFFGREDILDTIRDTLERKKGIRTIVLHGARRTGKTSLLLAIRDGRLGSRYLPVFIDMQAFAGASLPTLLRGIAQAVYDALGGEDLPAPECDIPPPADATLPRFRECIASALDSLGSRELLLLFDEYEILQPYLEDHGLAQQFQGLFEREEHLAAVFSGARKLEQMQGKNFLPLLDAARYIKISFLEPEAAAKLITEPAGDSLRFNPDAVKRIQELTSGHPFYIQLLCQMLFDAAAGQGEVTRELVNEITDKFLENPTPHLILTWKGLSTPARIAGATLASLQQTDATTVAPADMATKLREERFPLQVRLVDLEQGLNGLREVDWVTSDAGGSRYKIEIVRLWVTRERSILLLAEEQREELLKTPAGYPRQLGAMVIDAIAPGLAVMVSGILDLDLGLVVITTALTQLVVMPCLLQATLGQWIAGIRILPQSGTGRLRASLIYGLAASVRFILVIVLLALVAHFGRIAVMTETSVIPALILILTIALLTVDQVLIARGRYHQGTPDRIASVVLVPREPERQP
jgi:hypothetical protein